MVVVDGGGRVDDDAVEVDDVVLVGVGDEVVTVLTILVTVFRVAVAIEDASVLAATVVVAAVDDDDVDPWWWLPPGIILF